MKHFDARSLSPSAQEALRFRAVEAVRGGASQSEVARLLGMHRQVISLWVQHHRRGGPAALRSRRKGRPPLCRLKPHQAATIVRLITDRCPDQLKLPFALWTREAVRDLIARRYGIGLSLWTVGRYLNRWGFTPQKPARRAYEQDPEAVRQWLRKRYPAVRALARRERATIYWGDETGLRSDHQRGRSFSPRGRTPVVPCTGQRFGCNMISALTNRGKLAFMVFHGTFKAAVFLRFLRRLRRHAERRRVFLIVDGYKVHKAALVMRWLAKPASRMRLFYLPGYSPDINPDEYLNNDVKGAAVGRKRPRTREELVSNVRRFMRSTQRRPAKVRRYFRHPKVRYAAAGRQSIYRSH